MAELLGSLLVRLGLDSGAFKSGLDASTKQFRQAQKQFEKIGQSMADVGAKMSLGITAPLLAIGAAGAAAAGELAKSVPEIERLAQVSGTGFEEFQRLAYAAKSVGFEADKMGDVLKDVLDKVGDFQATGGGEMADFFENIAPKVGITAEAFKGLSGADALQLYYSSLQKAGVSQAEMVFYLEALADEASSLAPLLRDNGKAMTEMGAKAAVIGSGDVASMKAYNEAQKEMAEAFKKLTIAVVNSGILDAVTGFVTKVADFASRLSQTNPALLQFAVGLGAVAAAVGPILVAFGGLVQIIAPLLAKTALGGLAAVIAPILPALAALAAVGAVIYQNWDKIAPALNRLWETISSTLGPPLQEIIGTVSTMLAELWNGPFGEAIREAGRRIAAFGQAVANALGPVVLEVLRFLIQRIADVLKAFLDFGRAIGSLIDGDIVGAFRHLGSAINNFFGGLPAKIIGWMGQLVTGVRSWMVDKLNAVWDWVIGKLKVVGQAFYDLYDAVVGHSYIPDMVDEIGQNMRRLDAEMVDPAEKAAQKTGDVFRELQQRVADIYRDLFPEIRDQLDYDQRLKNINDMQDALLRQATTQREILAIERERSLLLEASRRQREGLNPNPYTFEASPGTKSIEEMSEDVADRMGEVFADVGERADVMRVQVIESFAQMVQGAMSELERFANGIKSGNFFDVIGGILGTLDKFGSLFTGGKGFNIGGFQFGNTSGGLSGALASGGPAFAGRNYLVGEEGPEIFSPHVSGAVIPNDAIGARGGIAMIVPSPYFDVVVDGQIQRRAPAIAQAGADGGVSQIQRRQSRSY